MTIIKLLTGFGLILSLTTPASSDEASQHLAIAHILELSSTADTAEEKNNGLGWVLYPPLRNSKRLIHIEGCTAHFQYYSPKSVSDYDLELETILDLRRVYLPDPSSERFTRDMQDLRTWDQKFAITAHAEYRWTRLQHSVQPLLQSEGDRMALATLHSYEEPERFQQLVIALWAYQAEYCTASD